MPKQCAATRRDGQPCTAPALGQSAYCFAHDPTMAERRAKAREAGGRNKANVVRLRAVMPPRLVPLFETLETALGEVHDGKLDPKKASAMASLARAMVSVLTSGELEERVRVLERGRE
jgi:hypothetical protein